MGSLACQGCGSITEPGDAYCWYCGFPLSKEAAAARPPAPTVAPTAPVPKAAPLPSQLQPRHPAIPQAPAPAQPKAPAVAAAEAALQEKSVMESVRAAVAEDIAQAQERGAGAGEQSWQLPQGTFKITSVAPRAGRVRE